MTDVVFSLVRHAATGSNGADRFMGSIDEAATPAGLAEMAEFGRTLDLDRYATIHTSPLVRASASAAVLRGGSRPDARLAERRLGEWEGLKFGAVRERWPEAYLDSGILDARVTPPGGESLDEFSRRVLSFLNEAADRSETVLIVTHNGWIRTAGYLLGDHPVEMLYAESVPHARLIDVAASRVRESRM